MRTFDLAPLYRSTVGFDRLFSMLDGFEAAPGYPPYNIERTGENAYRISVAVAGFGENELSIEAKENTLTIKGEKKVEMEEEKGDYYHSERSYGYLDRTIALPQGIDADNAKAKFKKGVLKVTIPKKPEAQSSRRKIELTEG